MKNLLILLSTLLALTACKTENKSDGQISLTHQMHMQSTKLYNRIARPVSPNFIASYVVPTKIDYIIEPLHYDWPDGIIGSPPNITDESLNDNNHIWTLDSLQFNITLNCNKQDREYMNSTCANYLQKTAYTGGFTALAEQFNDTKYDGGYWVAGVVFSPLKYLTITCDTDFDAQHPAGTPLDDIITVKYFSAEKFIKSGYSDMEAGDSHAGFTENLAKLNTMNINLHTSFICTFNTEPVEAGVYQFTVEYKSANGLILSKELPKIRLKGEL